MIRASSGATNAMSFTVGRETFLPRSRQSPSTGSSAAGRRVRSVSSGDRAGLPPCTTGTYREPEPLKSDWRLRTTPTLGS